MSFFNRFFKQFLFSRFNQLSWLVLFLVGSIWLSPRIAASKILENNKNIIVLQTSSGEIIRLGAAADDDGDGIENALEINGFTYDPISGLQAWDGDSSKVYFKTDPLRWSSDGDPYDDYTEATQVNIPANLLGKAEGHPLVAARPVVVIGMTSYDVIPNGEITNSRGGDKLQEYTNETSTTTEKGGEVEVSAGWSATEGLSFGTSAKASYSQSKTKTQSSTNAWGQNWNTALSSNPTQAAKLKLRIYMHNIGSAEIFDVKPTFNLMLGNKTISTIALGDADQADRLASEGLPGDRYPQTGEIVIGDDDSNPIYLTMDELRAIQLGAPLKLVVTQVSANAKRWDPINKSFNSNPIPWSQFEGEIDPVVVTLKANLGEEQSHYYQVYIGDYFNYTFKDVLSLVFDVDNSTGETFIEDRKYPDDWYVSSSSDELSDEWERIGRPENILDMKMFRQSKIFMNSPGMNPKVRIDMAIFSLDFKHVYVSAFPGNFPILSVKARVKMDGRTQEIELFGGDDALFSNTVAFDLEVLSGQVIVENARGDLTEVEIAKPAIFTSAADVKAKSPFLPNPGAEYFISLQGDSSKIEKIYCQFFDRVSGDSLDIPRNYLTLPEHAHAANYVDWSFDGQSGRAYYSKILLSSNNLDTAAFRVVGWDLTWATGDIPDNWENDLPLSFGSVSIKGEIDSVFANMDLSGTPYSIDPGKNFNYGDYEQKYSSIFIDESRQILNVIATKPADYTSEIRNFVGLDPYRFNLTYKRNADLGRKTFNSHLGAVGVQSEGFVNMGQRWSSVNKTIEAWINVGQYAMDPGFIDNYDPFHDLLGEERHIMIASRDDGTIQLRLGLDDDRWQTFNMHYKANLNEWLHVAYSFERAIDYKYTVKGYINGNLFQTFMVDGISEIGSSFGYPPPRFMIGNNSDQFIADNFSAKIDEVRLWNKVRTEEEIQVTMQDTLGPDIYGTDSAGLIGYWRFDIKEDLGIDEQKGTIWRPYYEVDGADDVRDYSISAKHGDLSGSSGLVTITAIESDNSHKIVRDFSLEQNYPNPFNPSTTIAFSLVREGQVELVIFNVQGQKMMTLVNGRLGPGAHKVQFDAQNLPSGLYFYQLSAATQKSTKRMLLIK